MFTGIVTDVGTVRTAHASERGLELTIATAYGDLELGESIAVDGACLTVAATAPGSFTVQVVPTTLERTRFGDLRYRAAGSTSSAPSGSATASAATSCRVTWTASGRCFGWRPRTGSGSSTWRRPPKWPGSRCRSARSRWTA